MNVGRIGDWWVARAPWSEVTAQGPTLAAAVERVREAVALRQAVVPAEQVVVAVDVPAARVRVPTRDEVQASGAEVQRVLERVGYVVEQRTRHHAVLAHGGAVLVLPLEADLAAPTLAEVLRQAGLAPAELRALL